MLNKKGIKVLSLFFIDKVSNYREYDKYNNPIKFKYAKMFEEKYTKLITLVNIEKIRIKTWKYHLFIMVILFHIEKTENSL